METILKIDNIEKYYGNKSNMTKAIDGISFAVETGEFVAIMGASGSGKTTLLNCVSTIDKVSSGHIYVGGKDITTLKGNKLNEFRREEPISCSSLIIPFGSRKLSPRNCHFP